MRSDLKIMPSNIEVGSKSIDLYGPLSDILELGIDWSLSDWVKELLLCLNNIDDTPMGKKFKYRFEAITSDELFDSILRCILLKLG